MRLLAASAAALLAACTPADPPAAGPEPSSRYTLWRPAPVLDAPEPAEVLARSAPADWRAVEPDDLLLLDLADGGRVAIELAPQFAPVHVANARALARAGWWRGATVYRVQDNYVAQWGQGEGGPPLPPGVVERPPHEYFRALQGLSVRPLGYPDSYAPMAGHADGWPVGYNPEAGRLWLAHCHGAVGVARGLAPDTGSAAELYTVIGHAPRHLDRNIAVVGRVIEGLHHLSARPRGTGNLGFYENPAQRVPIASIRLASQLPESERPRFEVLRTDTATFAAWLTGRANRGGDFFEVPAGGVDLCNAPVPVRRRP